MEKEKKPEIQKLYDELEDCGKYYNMTRQIFEDEHYYICYDGRELRHIRTETKEQEDIRRHLRCMDAPTAAAANIKPDAYINMTPKNMQKKQGHEDQ